MGKTIVSGRGAWVLGWAVAAWCGTSSGWAGPNDEAPIRFNRDVRPLLADRCFACHGPDEAERHGGLRLDRSDGEDGAYRVRRGRAAVQPGDVTASELWRRVTLESGRQAMPPLDSHEQPLERSELDVLRRWIEQGAAYQDHWAFEAPVAPTVPRVDDSDEWCRQPLDHFVLKRLHSIDREPSARADRRTLIRRLTFDLTGLPPTQGEIAEFLRDSQAGAVERVVDRLLASPRYGEHMAKSWLDLVRFADTNGIHHDHYRELSPYRDWVIRAFNENLPFDQFLTDQLAGDLRETPSEDQLIASGFHRLHLIIDVGTALPEESLARNIIDRTTAVGTAFLGLTVQCAVCHDHKYDPFTQRDFFQLSAFFNNLDADPETGRNALDKRLGLQQPYVRLPSDEQREVLAYLQREIDAATAAGDDAALKEKAREREAVLTNVPTAMVMKERQDVRVAHILERGAYDQPGDAVERATPGFLPPLEVSGAMPSRLDLARWFLAPEHPLTARVAVNRFWQQLFGVGLVKTSEDFGTQGEWPRHLALLDYLSVSFRTSGWDVKSLMRRIVLSATYQQSSDAPSEAYRDDPENRELARGSRFRMDAEMIRDQVLATSGLLHGVMGGKSVKPPQPDGVWKAVTLPSSYPRTYVADTGGAAYRRSIYTFWKRGMPHPPMTLLNAPTRESCTTRRERTNTPLQALLFMNEPEMLKAARALAQSVLQDAPPDQRLVVLYERVTSQRLDADERRLWTETLDDLLALYSQDVALAEALCDGAEPSAVPAAELAAWTALASTLFTLDRTKTRD